MSFCVKISMPPMAAHTSMKKLQFSVVRSKTIIFDYHERVFIPINFRIPYNQRGCATYDDWHGGLNC